MHPCIPLWQKNSNICPTSLPPAPILLSLSALHSLILQIIQPALSPPFFKFPLPLTPCPSSAPDGLLFSFQSNLSTMHGGFGLTTCPWMLGMGRIFFFLWRGELEVAASGGCPYRHLLSKTVQNRRRGEEITLKGQGLKLVQCRSVHEYFK